MKRCWNGFYNLKIPKQNKFPTKNSSKRKACLVKTQILIGLKIRDLVKN